MVQEKLRNELIGVLENELALHKEMLSLLSEEKEHIIKDPKALNEITKKKDAILEQVHKREDLRQRLIMNVAGVLNMSAKDVTLVFLAKVWSEPKLVELRKELKSVLQDIKTKQQLNSALIQQGLGIINSYVNAMSNNPKDSVYDKKGNLKESKGSFYRYLNQKI
jgi:flagellar biosynthesis/type III secretory pathway chaperone